MTDQEKIAALSAEIARCKDMQTALLKAAQEWRDMFDSAKDSICMVNKDGTVARCNRTMQNYLDQPYEEILGKNAHALLHPADESPESCPLTSVLKSLRSEVKEYTLGARTYMALVDPLFNERNECIALVHTMIDITDRIWLSQQLRTTNELLYNIIESSSAVSIITTDLNHNIVYWNKGAKNIFGYNPEEVLGKPIDIIYSKDESESEKILSARDAVLVNKTETSCQVEQLRKDGSTVWLNLTISPRVNNNNEIVGAIGIGEDITERKNAEQEAKRLQAILLQSQKMEAIGTLAGGVAHDFSNLLTIIRGYIDILIENIGDESPLQSDLNKISIATSRASNLTRQLLMFSRRNQPMEHAVSDMNQVLNNVMKMLERLIRENIKIRLVLDPDLFLVPLDEGYLEQVITNLVVNARDAMPTGGTVTIRTENVHLSKEDCKIIPESYSGKFVRLSVQDSGVGMTQETVGHIFEPFFTTKKPGEGTGLGLSVIYGIIKQHNGWINVYSEPEKGAIFKIYLPAITGIEDAHLKKESAAARIKGKGETILVIEDEEMIAHYTARVFQAHNYRVLAAKDGAEAAAVFRAEQESIDLAFIDIMLPDTSGLALAETFLLQKPGLRVVFTSGYMDDKIHWSTIQEKGYRFLQKPFGTTDLLSAVRTALDAEGK